MNSIHKYFDSHFNLRASIHTHSLAPTALGPPGLVQAVSLAGGRRGSSVQFAPNCCVARTPKARLPCAGTGAGGS